MDSTDAVVIPLSKTKLWWASIGCVVFIIIGFFFVLSPWYLRSPLIHALWVIRVIGFISLIVFGYFLGAHIPKLQDRSPGLVIDSHGIHDNSTDSGLLEAGWEEIEKVYPAKITFNKYMVVKLKSPEDFIRRMAVNSGRKRVMTANYRMSGSPISIPASTLKCSFKELQKYLEDGFEKYKKEE